MTYISHLNTLIRAKVSATPRLVAYGQNITAGSCLSGLTRGLEPGPGGRVINTPNVENTLVGAGFGMALRGVDSIYFMKQQDFLLLGLDHLVNTWNIIRRMEARASFTVVAVIVDSGFEGPQSSLNNFNDFCSMSHMPGYVISNARDAELVIGRHLVAPGCRMIGLSQRLFGTPKLAADLTAETDTDGDILRYAKGPAATIVACNLAFPQALATWGHFRDEGLAASLFSVPAMLPRSWDFILADVARSGHLVVIDDSKSENRNSDRLMLEAYKSVRSVRITSLSRDFDPAMLSPNRDALDVDPAALVAWRRQAP